MNVPFQSLPLETQIQVVIVYIDMALEAAWRFLRVAVPLLVIAVVVFVMPSRRRRGPR
jgi:hypothetical protein